MVQELKKSTAIVVHIGQFLDVSDGFTPETGITLSGADEAEVLKHAATTTTSISGLTWTAITGCDGWYRLSLTTSETDTLGMLEVIVQDDSVCLPVSVRFAVVTANYWDSKYGTDFRQVDVKQWEGTNVPTPTVAGVPTVAVPTSNANADALLDRANGVEASLTLREALRVIVASAGGKLSGATTTTIVIRNAKADTKDRITATVDADGNRSAVTLDLT